MMHSSTLSDHPAEDAQRPKRACPSDPLRRTCLPARRGSSEASRRGVGDAQRSHPAEDAQRSRPEKLIWFFFLAAAAIAVLMASYWVFPWVFTLLFIDNKDPGSTEEWSPPVINIEAERACLEATGSIKTCITQRRRNAEAGP